MEKLVNKEATDTQILRYLKQVTNANPVEDSDFFTTAGVSNKLHISRTLASQYLNEMYRNGLLIKVSARPVLYFHKKTLEQKYQITLDEDCYMSVDELRKLIDVDALQGGLEQIVGYYGSLTSVVQQMKAAMAYPPQGLPVVLLGENGTGKSYLVSKMYEYLLRKKLIKANAKFYKVRFFKDQKNYESILFNEKDGILTTSKDGMVYLSHAQNIDMNLQVKLADWFTKRNGNLRVVIGFDGTELSFESELMTKFPIICKIPAFDQRYEDEREQLIFRLFQKQQEQLKKEIIVPSNVLEILKDHVYPNHLHDLEKVIQNICATAYLRNENTIKIRLLDLSNEYLKTIPMKDEDTYYHVSQESTFLYQSKIIQLFKQLLQFYETKGYQQGKKAIKDSFGIIQDYYDYLMFEHSVKEERLTVLEQMINEVVQTTRTRQKLHLPMNCVQVLARVVDSSSRQYTSLLCFEDENRDEIEELIEWLKLHITDACVASEKLVYLLNRVIDINLPMMVQAFLAINIYMYNQNLRNQDTIGIIIMHGYATASSMAEAVNNLLQDHVFDGVDMPLDTSAFDIFEKINEFLSQHPYYKNLIVLVDMGSLERMDEYVNSNVHLGVINNVSTAVALDIGNRILKNQDIDEILPAVKEKTTMNYHIVHPTEKEDAVLVVHDTGIEISAKIASMLVRSLPKSIPLKIIEYDYDSLLANGTSDSVFKQYNVRLVVKSHEFSIKGVTQVALEDIINNQDIAIINNVLKSYLDEEEIAKFNDSLLKNFSLISIMEHLTILNAKVLLDYVSEAVFELQNQLNIKLKSKTIVGLYMHLCFMVERLVTKNAIEQEKEDREFYEKHKEFAEAVLTSFAVLLDNYRVEISMGEIRYLYDYIQQDRKE